jgi:hypothetical protein
MICDQQGSARAKAVSPERRAEIANSLASRASGARRFLMATLTFPINSFDTQKVFSAAEDSVSFVEKSLDYAKRLPILVRALVKLTTLTVAFEEAAKEQDVLVNALNGPALQSCTPEKYLELAHSIEHLVSLNNSLLEQVACYNFAPWKDCLNVIASQRDTLESLAESFHMAADVDVDCETLLAVALDTVGV